jgi:hypothetical protein
MVFAGQLAVGAFDLHFRRRPRYPQDLIVIFELYGHGRALRWSVKLLAD